MFNEPQTPNGDAPSMQSMFSDPAIAANPFPLFEQLRSMGDMMQIPAPLGEGTAWLITRLEDAVQIMKDKRYTVEMKEPPLGMSGLFGKGNLPLVDGSCHTRLRGLVSKAFTPRFIENLRPRVQQIADELLDRVEAKGEMDLVADYAYPLPINVISDMLGVPHEDQEKIQQWSNVIAQSASIFAKRDETNEAQAFSDYVVRLIAEKRQHPGNDLISQLVAMEQAGDHLDQEELLTMISLLIFAGHETTSNLISIGTLMLLDYPDQLERLKSDLSLVPNTVEELLRFNGPVTMPAPRYATEDLQFGGKEVHQGEMMIIILAAANRDEREYTDPNEFDIARDLNRHMAFGQGVHYCLGAPLARLEGEIAFATLLKRFPNIHFGEPRESIMWRENVQLRGLQHLQVAF
ncbi:MAG: cytochrome P450 [Anaerolineae bacterium]|nr:cytochrome P450 [Anaerolineae bacterium]